MHEAIVEIMESKVKQLTAEELEGMNAKNRQASVPPLKHAE